MKNTITKKGKKVTYFNRPLQIMLSLGLEKRIQKRIEHLSKSKANYVRDLIIEDLNNSDLQTKIERN